MQSDIITLSSSSLWPTCKTVKERKSHWHWDCVDTGAQRTVIREKQACPYWRYVCVKFKTKPNKNIYRFSVGRQKSHGPISIRIPTPDNYFMLVSANVVSADAPFLVGRDTLDTFGLYLDTVKNVLRCAAENWEIPATRKLGHAYIRYIGCADHSSIRHMQ